MVAQVLLAGLALSVAALLATGVLQVWHLVVVAMLNGAVWSVNLPGRQAFISELVGEERLVNAMSLNSAAFNLTSIGGPLLAGFLLEGIGPAGVYFLITACYGYVVFTLTHVPKSRVTGTGERASVLQDMVEGYQFIRKDPAIVSVLLLGLIPTLFGWPYMTFLPVFAKDVLSMDASGLGVLTAASGFGALLGTMVLAFLGNFPRKALTMVGVTFAFGVMLIAFANSTNVVVSLVAIAVMGVFSVGTWTLSAALLQILTPMEYRGRIMGLVTMSWGLMPLGTLPLSLLADAVSAPFALTVSATVMIAVTLLLFLLRPNLRTV